jgi:nucleoside-diphosphate-sugar epimerase
MAPCILITGANGFIGSYTTLLFESLGHRVLPLDVKPRPDDLSILPVATSTRELDVTDSTAIRELCKKEKVTHIFHAAYPRRDEDPEVLDFSLQAMRSVLETAKEEDVQRVVFASSGALYGQLRREGHDLVREGDPVAVHPAYLYRSAKILGEWLGDFYSQRHGVSFVALRFSSVYGPGQTKGIGAAIRDGLLGRACRPYLTRLPDDMVFVKDVVQAVRLACFCDRPMSRAYNIASGRPYTEKDLEQAMRGHLPDVTFELGKHPNAATIGLHRSRDLLDTTLAREELGWVPQFDLDSGIADIAEWVRRNIKQLG